jgi:hypothetical protein
MSVRAAKLFVAAVVVSTSVGCVVDPGPTEKSAGSLADVTVASKFDFEATRPVALTLSVSSSLVPEGDSAGLELTRGDGNVVYRGPIRSGTTFKAQLVVPSSEQTLHAVLRGDKELERSATLTMIDGHANHVFE